MALARLEARLPFSVLKQLKRAAELQGRTLTDFVIAASQEAARRAIEEAGVLRLSLEDQERIAKALISPPAMKPAMDRALKRRRALLGT